ncbi:MAG: riboflavin biosynthesis protein RibF [Clostridia bacterium]|nr:riboflavin biosynthesis protein RibF [Clostridia bacterium]
MTRILRGSRAVALGCFDGFHRGHRVIIEKTVSIASELGLEPAAVTFVLPPASYLSGSFPGILTGTVEKIRLLEECGIKTVVAADFEEVKDLSASEFAEEWLLGRLDAAVAVCGADFTFGSGASGNADTLRDIFGENAVIIPYVTDNLEKISSSGIRRLISEGCVERAAALLGRPYSLGGTRISGRGDGRRLGFPTVNMIPAEGFVIPARGVYIADAVFSGGERFRSVTDVGVAPTLDSTGVLRTETHLLCPSGTAVPDGSLTLLFRKRLRGEKLFPSAEALRLQIARDVSRAEKYYSLLGIEKYE